MLNFMIHLLLNKFKNMKVKALLLIMAITLVSCGGDKTKNAEVKDKTENVSDNYVVEVDAIYEKNDSLVFFYEVDGIVKYENPITLKVTGAPTSQHLLIRMPENTPIENLIYTVSTNKEQPKITITNVTIKNGEKTIDGTNYKYGENFFTDESFKWNDTDKSYILNHANKYPPALVGNDKLRASLSQ